MANWEFEERPENLLEQDLTQRDQFNNDDVDLSEALVREVIQNSTDAHDPDSGSSSAKVRFSLSEISGDDAQRLKELVSDLGPHLKATGINPSIIDQDPIRLLTIEDFNTIGLTGAYDDLDNGNFQNFWRRHGRSGKEGSSGGRWGLGKLVYSSSSRIRSFFGITLRKGTSEPLLLGQSVLANHEIGEEKYYWYGYYANRNEKRFQLPESNPAFITSFSELAGLTRTTQSGLSIAVPFVRDSITEDRLLQGVINNYYFPILSGKLVVEINDTVIDADRFDEAVEKAGGLGLVPIDFVKQVDHRRSSTPDFTGSTPITTKEIEDSYFGTEALSDLRDRYSSGETVHVRFPVELENKSKGRRQTHIDVFLQKLPEGADPYALFIRGAITVPGELKCFAGAQARGALLAAHEDIVAFLGDAENPAHTAWNERADKLTKDWATPSRALRAVRHAMRKLYVSVAQEEESRDQDVLMDFFSLADLACSSSGKRKKTPKPKPDVPSRKRAFFIREKNGGFTIVPGPGAEDWDYPKTMRVRVAYDMLGSNPFKRHSPFDFDLSKESSDIAIDLKGAKVKPVKPNVLALTIEEPEFECSASGFDENRDLVVQARAIP